MPPISNRGSLTEGDRTLMLSKDERNPILFMIPEFWAPIRIRKHFSAGRAAQFLIEDGFDVATFNRF